MEPIPEYDVADAPPIFQPLVPPPVIIPKPFSENISFPTTLQPRGATLNERFDMWRSQGGGIINAAGGTVAAAAMAKPRQQPIIGGNINATSTSFAPATISVPPIIYEVPLQGRTASEVSIHMNIHVMILSNICAI